MASLVGETIGQYEVVEHLGQGGMADVYKAFHPGLAIYRALKVIRMELGAGSDFKERFQREAQAVAGLRHPNIVRMQDFGIHDGLYYMVMEFIEGRDLKAELTERGPIRPLTEVADIITQVASALTYAHERDIVHRDVKPANMMRTTDGQVILTDFGIAKMLTTDEPITQTGVGIGTPAYMSPEQAQGLPTVGPPTDIYSLGVVLYQMISGRVPYSADTPMAVALKVLNEPLPPLQAEVSDAIRAVVRKATAKEPANRYETADALAEALAEAVEAEPEPASSGETVTMALDAPEESAAASDEKSSDAPSPVTKSSSSNGALVAVIVLLVAVVGAGAGLYLFRGAWMPLVFPSEDAPAAQASLATTDSAAAASATDSASEAATDSTASSAITAEASSGPSTETAATSSSEAAAPEQTTSPEPTMEAASSSAANQPATTDEPTATAGEATGAPTTDASATPSSESREPAPSERPSAVASASDTNPPPGFYVEDAVNIPGQTATFTYEGEAGEEVYFDFVSSTADADFVLRGPDGEQVLKAFMEDAGPVTLSETGAYTLTVDPWGQGTPSFEFVLRRQ